MSRPYFFYPFGGERVTRASKRAIMRAASDAVKGHPGKWVNVYTPAGRFFRVLPGGLGRNQIFVSSSFFLRSFSI